MTTCLHCGQPLPAGRTDAFCCNGCKGAYALISGLHLNSYYQRRTLDDTQRALVPETQVIPLLERWQTCKDGQCTLHVMVDGLHCAACVWLIESVLQQQVGIVSARVNMTTHRLKLVWQEGVTTGAALVQVLNQLGYRALPYDPQMVESLQRQHQRQLLQYMAVAGFAAANVMLFSVALWAGAEAAGDSLTRLLQWLSALVVLPATAYAGQPFFRGAWGALRHGRTNMDVPIALALLLTLALSLYDMTRPLGESGHTWFESTAMLLFFLLVGRFLDARTRGQATGAAEQLLRLQGSVATRCLPDGTTEQVPTDALQVGDEVQVAVGMTCPADGVVIAGESTLDRQLLTGESLPVTVAAGAEIAAGVLNLSAPLRVRVNAVGEATTLAHMATLVERAIQGRHRYTAVADRVAQLYAPVVHGLAALTFFGWWLGGGAPVHSSLTIAISVLIITCPCALALAVPTVQVAAVSRLLRQGAVLTVPTALERLAQVRSVVLDKTGTLTQGRLRVVKAGGTPQQQGMAAALAQHSQHPLARALATVAQPLAEVEQVQEVPGQGLQGTWHGQEVRLGSATFCAVETPTVPPQGQTCVWLRVGTAAAVPFLLEDTVRENAREAVAFFQKRGVEVWLLSGDEPATVQAVAADVGIPAAQAVGGLLPADKHTRIKALMAAGKAPLMVGDGINDAPALAAAQVGVAMAGGADLSKQTADVLVQRDELAVLPQVWQVGRQARRLVHLNFMLALGYNALAVPAAMAGYVTPVWAALFMSASSMTVVLNALRMMRQKEKP